LFSLQASINDDAPVFGAAVRACEKRFFPVEWDWTNRALDGVASSSMQPSSMKRTHRQIYQHMIVQQRHSLQLAIVTSRLGSLSKG
jgi:hypothetical protein